MSSLISVIIPVYKVEDYLDKCVESIVNQTYKNLEIILVDDGSPDNCPRMCDAWAEKDDRIKVIHKQNGGLSDARNCGIDNSTGDYLIFIDSDDYIALNTIDILYNCAVEYNCDVAVGRLIPIIDGIKTTEQVENMVITADKFAYWETYFKNLFSACVMAGNYINACGKLINRNLMNEIRFPYGRINEDTFTTYKIFDKANLIAFADYEMYYYIKRENSISHKVHSDMKLDILDALKARLEYFSMYTEVNENLYKYAYVDYLDNIIKCYIAAKYEYKDIDLACKLKKCYLIAYKKAKKAKALSTALYRDKVLFFWSFTVNEYLFRFVRKLKRR